MTFHHLKKKKNHWGTFFSKIIEGILAVSLDEMLTYNTDIKGEKIKEIIIWAFYGKKKWQNSQQVFSILKKKAFNKCLI